MIKTTWDDYTVPPNWEDSDENPDKTVYSVKRHGITDFSVGYILSDRIFLDVGVTAEKVKLANFVEEAFAFGWDVDEGRGIRVS